MSNCEKYLDLISAYVDGEVADTEKAEIEAHLEECAECRSILEAYREMSEEIAFGDEEVPEGFADGVMAKVSSYEKKARNRRKNFRIAGRYAGIAACIALVLVAFPRMPHLGCGASKDAAMETTTAGATMDTGADFDMFFDAGTKESAPAEPEYAVDNSFSYTDEAEDSLEPESENDKYAPNASQRADVGMVVTLYGEIPEELLNSDYTVTYYENGDVEYIVPVDVARDIAAKYDNAEVEVLDTEIDGMMAKIIIKK